MSCTECETLKYNINQLENMIATLEQENRQQHARNVRLQTELDAIEKRNMPLSYAQIKESFLR